MKPSAYSYTTQDWERIFQKKGAADFWLKGLYKNRAYWEKNISPDLIRLLERDFDFDLPVISQLSESADQTFKFQMQFKDGLEVETVLIPFNKRYTVCLSTQVGCAMSCSFCYTGTQGLKRNLSAGEIVGQYLKARQWLFEKIPGSINPRIVFMGQGEPLHNTDEVLQAIKVLTDKKTIALGPREMTLSTVGFLPGLKRMQEFPRINMALSLHSPFEDQRSELIPLTKKYALSEVMASLDELPQIEKRIVTYEYLLIKDFNMSEAHAEGLQALLGHRRAVLNLIPFNPFPGSSYQRPHRKEIDDFKELLVKRKLRALIRTTKGDEILAACGQLKIPKLARSYGKS